MPSLDPRQLMALEQAAQWYSRLACEDATPEDQLAWQAWLDAEPLHHWAWQQAERLQSRLRGMPGPLARHALGLADRNRRAVLKTLVLLAGTGALGWGGSRAVHERAWLADRRSGIGERTDTLLADGSRLQLNSDSAVDIRYGPHQRLLVLRRGELLLTTHPDPLGRPLAVQTPAGLVQALGTRFSVRLADDGVTVAVFHSRVRIVPAQGSPVLLEAGQQCRFDARGAGRVEPLAAGRDAWSKGLLVANDQRLDHFLAELSRHRPGLLRCDPSIAGLRISGTFALDDTDQALRALADSLPVRIERRTRYWVSVVPVNT